MTEDKEMTINIKTIILTIKYLFFTSCEGPVLY